MALRIPIFDSQFLHTGAKSFGMYLGENADYTPKHIEWDRQFPDDYDKTFDVPVWITDACLFDAEKVKAPHRIAWLLEPRCMTPQHFDFVEQNQHLFSRIITNDSRMLNNQNLDIANKTVWFPAVGSLVKPDDWEIHPKTKFCSMIVSSKTHTGMHKFRRDVWQYLSNPRFGIDFFGEGVGGQYTRKIDTLRDYQYHIVIEGCIDDTFFSEKIVDCFATGTIPIYMGAKCVNDFFDLRGIVPVKSLYDMITQATILRTDGYSQRHFTRQAIRNNFNKSKEFFCLEDWMWKNIRDTLEGRYD